MTATPILEMRGVHRSFGPVQVLRDVDFSAHAGEVTALVGDNGVGKSTLVKCIGGIYPIDAGQCFFEGEPVTVRSPRAAADLGIEIVYQDLALCENLNVVQNMFLGRERRSGLMLDEAAMEEAAARTLAGLSVQTVKSIRQRVAGMSGGQRQTVAIAKAVLWNSKVVILDEPTVTQTSQVLELVRRLADSGLAVVLISHNLNDVFAVSDRIAALYLGQTAAQVRTHEVTHSQVVELITTGSSGEFGLDAARAAGVAGGGGDLTGSTAGVGAGFGADAGPTADHDAALGTEPPGAAAHRPWHGFAVPRLRSQVRLPR